MSLRLPIGMLALCTVSIASGQDRDCLMTIDRPLQSTWTWTARCDAQDPDGLQGKSLNAMSKSPKASIWSVLDGVEYHESCFSSLSAPDRAQITEWTKRPSVAGSPQCRLEAFGTNLPPKRAMFRDDPATTAQSLSISMRHVIAVNDKCLKALNPDLSDRMRQALGKAPRPGSMEVIPPRIQCSERASFSCPLTEEKGCDTLSSLRLTTAQKYREGDLSAPKVSGKECSRAPNFFLAMADVTGQVPGQVVPGAAMIDVYEATPRFHEARSAAATLFHEFLHSAGAKASPAHNHGLADPATAATSADQVYACEAVAFSAAAPVATEDQLKALCRTCASSDRLRLCDKLSYGNLINLGCRSPR